MRTRNFAGRDQVSGSGDAQGSSASPTGRRKKHAPVRRICYAVEEVEMTPEMIEKLQLQSDLQKMRELKSCTFYTIYAVLYNEPLNERGTVLKCVRLRDGQVFAVKIRRWDIQRQFEVDVLHACRGNRHIVQMVADYGDVMFSYIILELLTGQPLMEHIRTRHDPLSEDMANWYFQQLLDGVACIHSHRFVHCALRPENVMFAGDNRTLRIIDFGWALPFGSVAGYKGSRYAPTEVLNGLHVVNYPLDMWGLGTILYEMFCGDMPFAYPIGASRETLLAAKTARKIRSGHYRPSCLNNRGLSNECRHVIGALLRPRPWQRASLLALGWERICKNCLKPQRSAFAVFAGTGVAPERCSCSTTL